MSLPNIEPSSASQLFRGISEPARNNYGDNTDIAELAEAHNTSSKANITKALEDFTSIFSDFHNSDVSNIVLGDIKSNSKSNMFKNDDARAIVAQMSIVTQSSIFAQNMASDGGLRYASAGSNIKSSAVEFAQTDIEAIEKAHNIARKNLKKSGKPVPYDQDDDGKKDTKLSKGEARSAHHDLRDAQYSKYIRAVNLDNDYLNISADEYASYLIVADALRFNEETGEYEFDIENADGLITYDEAKRATKIDDTTFKKFAQDVYDNYVTKFFKGWFDKAK